MKMIFDLYIRRGAFDCRSMSNCEVESVADPERKGQPDYYDDDDYYYYY